MTLQQLKYIVTVAETGNITEAAKRLFISQPSLTNAIRELEKEMQITIFHRTNKGVIISNEGPQDEAGLTTTFQTWPRGWFHIPKDPDFPVPS